MEGMTMKVNKSKHTVKRYFRRALVFKVTLLALLLPVGVWAQPASNSSSASGAAPSNSSSGGFTNSISNTVNGINGFSNNVGNTVSGGVAGTENTINGFDNVSGFDIGQNGIQNGANVGVNSNGTVDLGIGYGGLGIGGNLDIAGIFGDLGGSLSDTFGGFDLGGVGDFFGSVGGFFGDAFGGLMGIFGGIRDAFSAIARGARNIFDGFIGTGGGGARGARAATRGGSGDVTLPSTVRTAASVAENSSTPETGRASPGVVENTTAVAEYRAQGHDLKDAYDGWSSLNLYTPSPIIFDPISKEGMASKYPELAMADYHAEGRRLSLRHADISVDDEVRKTSMAIFQPLHDMELSFASGQVLRDRFLNMFATVRGVTILTLSYLDKTVAAGLATTEDQAQAHVRNHLLKNINHTTAKLANPEWAHVFRDHDDKVAHCIAHIKFGEPVAEYVKYGALQGNENGGASLEATSEYWQSVGGQVPDDVVRACEGESGWACGEVTADNAYDYCQCCAERSMAVHGTSRTPLGRDEAGVATGDGEGSTWSLAERIHLGRYDTGDDSKGQSAEDVGQRIRSMIETYRAWYGDVISYANGVRIQMSYLPPRDSLPALVTKFRNGCIFPEDTTASASAAGSDTCSDGYQSKKLVQYGVCPSMLHILRNWGPDGYTGVGTVGSRDALEPYFTEASLAFLITARDIENILALDNLQSQLPLGATWEPDANGKLYRWLNAFCDASAAAIVKKTHLMHKAILQDHLSMNRTATEQDKVKAIELMNRVSRQLDYADEDARSSFAVRSQLMGVAMLKDRTDLAELGAVTAAGQNATNNRAIRGSGGNNFGGPIRAVAP